ncbi:MAG: SLC13 family permease [Candidatus Sigynarchaeota archaeon]
MAQLISIVIVVAVLATVVVLIVTERLNRAAASVGGALVCFFVVTCIEGKQFSRVIEYIVGNTDDNYASIHSLFLIVGMLLIVQVCSQSGLFQFLAFNIIKLTGKNSFRLMVTINLLAIMITAVMNNILSVMILVPLIIMICRILDLDAKPFILTMGISVNLGAALFSISAIENILISTYVPFTFAQFFMTNGIVAMVLILPTMILFYFIYKKSWKKIETGIEILKEFDTWTFIPNKVLMYKSLFTLLGVMAFFILIPPVVIPPDIIALIGGILLVIISRLNIAEIFEKFDAELVFYLLGIFIISGAMYDVEILGTVAASFSSISGGNVLATTILVLWVSGYLAGVSDPAAITRIMMPVINHLGLGEASRSVYSALAFSTVLGDNLTAMGDNMVVVSLSKQHNRPVTPREIMRLGFTTVQFQFALLSIYFCFTIDPAVNWLVGLLLIIIVAGFIASFIVIRYLVHLFTIKRRGGRAEKPSFKVHDKSQRRKPLTDLDYND